MVLPFSELCVLTQTVKSRQVVIKQCVPRCFWQQRKQTVYFKAIATFVKFCLGLGLSVGGSGGGKSSPLKLY